MVPVFNYFGVPARGEATRVALAVAGVEFVDKIIPYAELHASGFRAVPVYQLDGTNYTQSTALLRYAGKLGGTYPEDPLEALKVDEIVMMVEDVFINIFADMKEKDEAKKLATHQALIAGKVKYLIEDIASKLEANTASPFCVGPSLTIADIMVHAMIATFQAGFLVGVPTTTAEDICPSLKGLDDAVMEHPKVKAYYASKA
nr:glutathione S-transferase [Saccharina japonica]